MNSNDPKLGLLLLAIVGALALINVFFPRLAWRMSEGWKFKRNLEPSDLWLFGTRVSGIILAAICLFLALKTADQAKDPDLPRDIRMQIEGRQTDPNLRIRTNPVPPAQRSPTSP